MLITCPSCASAYDLPVDRIGPSGRKVRCASCRESWFVASAEDNPTSTPSLEIESPEVTEIITRPAPAVDSRAEAEPKPEMRRRAGHRPKAKAARTPASLAARLRPLGRVAAVVAVCAALPSLLAFREKVVGALPGTVSLYRSVGLPVNLVGLNFVGVRSALSQEGDTPVLEVTGQIVNDGRNPRPVPSLQIALEGDKGERLYRWTAKATEGELQVGQSAPFRVRLTAPPPGARNVEVSFREDGRRAGAVD